MDLPSIEIFPLNENFATGIPGIERQDGILIGSMTRLLSPLPYRSNAPTLTAILDLLATAAKQQLTFEEAIWRQRADPYPHDHGNPGQPDPAVDPGHELPA